jgi:hypothetical protein
MIKIDVECVNKFEKENSGACTKFINGRSKFIADNEY